MGDIVPGHNGVDIVSLYNGVGIVPSHNGVDTVTIGLFTCLLVNVFIHLFSCLFVYRVSGMFFVYRIWSIYVSVFTSS